MISGQVSISSSGRISALTSPKISANHRMSYQCVNLGWMPLPCNRTMAAYSATALIPHRRMNFVMEPSLCHSYQDDLFPTKCGPFQPPEQGEGKDASLRF